MQALKDAANSVSEKVQKHGAAASKEVNKEVAKDPNVPVGTRARAAKDALVDKKDEHAHGTKEELYSHKS